MADFGNNFKNIELDVFNGNCTEIFLVGIVNNEISLSDNLKFEELSSTMFVS